MFELRHQIGDVIKDRYTIREVLGAGAFGTVYRVEETIGSRVLTLACKEMHVLSDPATDKDERGEALRMFQEEAYLLQTLRNPHIPAAYFEQEKGVWLACSTCGKTFRGVRVCPEHGNALQVVNERYYLLMDFLDGPDLEQLLLANGGRPLEEEPVLDWALQICDALEAVHAQGLSHRDIKPANIKIQGPNRQAMLIDFGLVKPANVAGAYGTVLKRNSTGTGTIGYAPESQEERIHPDARTDILAFGMTLYRLLTRRDPTEPADLAEMRRTTPGNLNLRLSESTNAIIIKMVMTNPADRYADVKSLRLDLQAARYPVQITCPHCGFGQRSALSPSKDSLCERCGRSLAGGETAPLGSKPGSVKKTTNLRSSSPPPVVSRSNPFEPRLRQIQEQLKTPVVAPDFSQQKRLDDLKQLLDTLAKQSVGLTQRCPGCLADDLKHVAGNPTGLCPICDGAQLMRREWDANTCAVCRTGHLEDRQLQGEQMFCPVCCRGPLAEEGRRRFGLVVDVWQVCPSCSAEFDIVGGGRARLAVYPNDPFGIAKEHGGQTLTLQQWREIGGRGTQYCECTHCAAQWDIENDGRLKLANFLTDPHGIAAARLGQSLTRVEWGKLAAGITAGTGNLNCPSCLAEFDYDRDSKTMGLVKTGKVAPPWLKALQGPPRPLPEWYLAPAGKTSLKPGWLCPTCHTEFDSEGISLKLVRTAAAPLKAHLGEVLVLQDWQRRGQMLPIGSEAHAMRAELQALIAQKQTESQHFLQAQGSNAVALENEFIDLLRQSVMGGFIPIQRVASNAPPQKSGTGIHISLAGHARGAHLRASEQVLWESGAHFCTARIENGVHVWMRGPQGTLLVTSERLIFSVAGSDDRPWDRALSKLETVQIQNVQGVSLVATTYRGEAITVGFELGAVRWDIVVDGKSYSLVFTPQELVTLLMQQIDI